MGKSTLVDGSFDEFHVKMVRIFYGVLSGNARLHFNTGTRSPFDVKHLLHLLMEQRLLAKVWALDMKMRKSMEMQVFKNRSIEFNLHKLI